MAEPSLGRIQADVKFVMKLLWSRERTIVVSSEEYKTIDLRSYENCVVSYIFKARRIYKKLMEGTKVNRPGVLFSRRRTGVTFEITPKCIWRAPQEYDEPFDPTCSFERRLTASPC
jgi:hypothetical protein